MQIVRLHDPGRRPADWTEIIRPGQFAIFAKDDGTGAPCDLEGTRFGDSGAATCGIVDSVAEARAFCEAAVVRHPAIRFDVFDVEGRARSPILTVVHPDRAAALDTSPREMRRRQVIAWCCIVAGIPMIVFAYVEFRERDIILPAFLGINAIIIGGRLLWMNMALRETERVREARLTRAAGDGEREP